MFYVVVLHILKQGGILQNVIGKNNDMAWLIEIMVYCAVDVYAIISGYAGYSEEQKKIKTSKYLSMWLQVFFYSFGITFILFFVNPYAVGIKGLVKSLFPVATKQYWYFSAYTGVFLLKPWLNRLVQAQNKKELTTFVLFIICIFSAYSTFASRLGGDPFRLFTGQSMIWLILLYIIGAWLKKCKISSTVDRKIALSVIVICIVITWIEKQYIPVIGGSGFLYSNISITVLLQAISYVIIFSGFKIDGKASKLVSWFAPAAFGVYLIHTQPIIWTCYLADAFVWVAFFATWKIPIIIFGSATIIFLCCIIIEKVRIVLFKLLRINILVEIIGNKIDRLLSVAMNKIQLRLKIN